MITDGNSRATVIRWQQMNIIILSYGPNSEKKKEHCTEMKPLDTVSQGLVQEGHPFQCDCAGQKLCYEKVNRSARQPPDLQRGPPAWVLHVTGSD